MAAAKGTSLVWVKMAPEKTPLPIVAASAAVPSQAPPRKRPKRAAPKKARAPKAAVRRCRSGHQSMPKAMVIQAAGRSKRPP